MNSPETFRKRKNYSAYEAYALLLENRFIDSNLVNLEKKRGRILERIESKASNHLYFH